MSTLQPSARLRVVLHGPNPPCEATVIVHHGTVTVHSDDDATFERVSHWIADHLLVDGKGFARAVRDANGAIVREGERIAVERWVGFDAGDEEVLLALRDGLEASGAFEIVEAIGLAS